MPDASTAVAVSQTWETGLLVALIAAMQIVLLAGMNMWSASRKDKRDAERLAAAAVLAAKLRSDEKEEEYRRQDVVAERVAKAAQQAADAAKLLLAAQAETIARTDAVAATAAAADARIQAQLIAIDEQGRKIHVLVNSDMTAARQAERHSLQLLVFALRKGGGILTGSEQKEVEQAEKRLADLDQIIADRAAAQKQIDDAASAMKSRRVSDASAVKADALLVKIEANTAQTAAGVEALTPSVPSTEEETST